MPNRPGLEYTEAVVEYRDSHLDNWTSKADMDGFQMNSMEQKSKLDDHYYQRHGPTFQILLYHLWNWTQFLFNLNFYLSFLIKLPVGDMDNIVISVAPVGPPL